MTVEKYCKAEIMVHLVIFGTFGASAGARSSLYILRQLHYDRWIQHRQRYIER